MRKMVEANALGARKQAGRPSPESATVSGLLAALEVMLRVPVWVPVTVGAKVTVTLQLAPVASDAGQVLVSVKGPLTVMPEIERADDPLLVMVTVPGSQVWFTCVPGNTSEVVESVTAEAERPVPLKETI